MGDDMAARNGRDGRDGRDSHSDTPTENRLTLAVILRDLAYIKEKIDQMCKLGDAQDDRLQKVERLTWAGASIVALLSAIFVPIAVAAVKKWFGLP